MAALRALQPSRIAERAVEAQVEASGPPPPPARRPLLAPLLAPPITVRPLPLPTMTWPDRASSSGQKAADTFAPGVRPPAPPPPLFASLNLAPSPPEAALTLVAAAWVVLVGLRRLVRRMDDGEDSLAGTLALSPVDLACRVAGALSDVGGSSSERVEGAEEEEEEDGGPAVADAETLAAYRRFAKGARLGRVREWA